MHAIYHLAPQVDYLLITQLYPGQLEGRFEVGRGNFVVLEFKQVSRDALRLFTIDEERLK